MLGFMGSAFVVSSFGFRVQSGMLLCFLLLPESEHAHWWARIAG